MASGYHADLAYIHDIGFGDFACNSSPGLLQILQQRGITNGLIVDLGCGSGIWAKALTDAGYDCLGIDSSAAMLALAKKKTSKARFQKASLFRVKFPLCDAVTALGECLNYQFDSHDAAELKALFARVYEALRPGGVFVFDVLQPGAQKGANPSKTFSEGNDWAILVEKEEDTTRHQLTRRMTMFRKVGTYYRRSTETHVVQLYKAADIARELRQIGFRVKLIRGYGEMKFRPAHVGFVAAKAAKS